MWSSPKCPDKETSADSASLQETAQVFKTEEVQTVSLSLSLHWEQVKTYIFYGQTTKLRANDRLLETRSDRLESLLNTLRTPVAITRTQAKKEHRPRLNPTFWESTLLAPAVAVIVGVTEPPPSPEHQGSSSAMFSTPLQLRTNIMTETLEKQGAVSGQEIDPTEKKSARSISSRRKSPEVSESSLLYPIHLTHSSFRMRAMSEVSGRARKLTDSSSSLTRLQRSPNYPPLPDHSLQEDPPATNRSPMVFPQSGRNKPKRGGNAPRRLRLPEKAKTSSEGAAALRQRDARA